MPEKILVVEDERAYSSLLVELLGHAGYSVVSAENGARGLKAYAEERPDLVLLDAILPDMDGLEFCRKIRADGPRGSTPILLCTVRSAMDRVAEGLRCGADGYILKPFEEEKLLSRVREALGKEP